MVKAGDNRRGRKGEKSKDCKRDRQNIMSVAFQGKLREATGSAQRPKLDSGAFLPSLNPPQSPPRSAEQYLAQRPVIPLPKEARPYKSTSHPTLGLVPISSNIGIVENQLRYPSF